MAETLNFRGSLKGHQGWVTAIATPLDPASDIVLSASRCVQCQSLCFLLLQLKLLMGHKRSAPA